MSETWHSRIRRAEQLARETPETSELLRFYAVLLRSQNEIYEYLRTRKDWLPCGELASDLPVLQRALPSFLKVVKASGPDALASEARGLLQARESELREMLIGYWRAPSDLQFFAKAFLQPYARWLAEIGATPVDRGLARGENRCPFCQGNPQVSVLRVKEAGSESGGRDLICSTCLTSWPFRRVVCANCLEENPANIGYFNSPHYEHVRVETCNSCKHYIKSIDLTRYGLAIPFVDEVATAPLDLWAREQGFSKIEMNLVGV